MATRKIETIDKYAGYRYKIVTPEELREAKWLIEVEHDFKDMDAYLDAMTKMEIKVMKHEDAEKKKRAAARKKRRLETVKKNKAA
jgi:hypothetical protein